MVGRVPSFCLFLASLASAPTPARAQTGDGAWEKCNVASCTCAGFCLASLRNQTFELDGLPKGAGTKYLVSFCDPLPNDASPTPGDGSRAGSLMCDGCLQASPNPLQDPQPPNCTAVRVLGSGICTGQGTTDSCSEFEATCGMSGRKTAGGGLQIRYQYTWENTGVDNKDDFIINIQPGATQSLGDVTEQIRMGPLLTTFNTTWTVPESAIKCDSPPTPTPAPGPPHHNEDSPDGECSAVCKDNNLALKPGAHAGDEAGGATPDNCCCEGAQGFFVMIFYVVIMFYMFVGLAIVCEEYFVPSLNVLCEKLDMSDDVAGATFMAAGASSPEMFASLIGVMDGSAVGAGTVVGSELFNMLVIVGAVCLCAGGTGLMLDWRPLIREVGFFMGSLFLLIFVLYDEEVQLWEGILLVSGYGGYVVVCAQYGILVRALCPIKAGDTTETGGMEQPFLEDNKQVQSTASSRQQQRVTMDGSMFGFEYGAVLMHGFLFKSSRYYSKIRMSGSKWQRRWFILTDDEFDENTDKVTKPAELRYCKNPLFAGRTSSRSIPIKAASAVKRTTPTEFELVTPQETFTFKAQKPEMAEAWVEKLQMKVEDIKLRESNLQMMAEQHQAVEEHPSVLAWPDTSGRRILYVTTFPMLLAFYLTIPDVRRARWTNFYPATMTIAVLYLALLADGMMSAAEKAGCLASMPEDLMGLTITAAGTSLPNLFASVRDLLFISGAFRALYLISGTFRSACRSWWRGRAWVTWRCQMRSVRTRSTFLSLLDSPG